MLITPRFRATSFSTLYISVLFPRVISHRQGEENHQERPNLHRTRFSSHSFLSNSGYTEKDFLNLQCGEGLLSSRFNCV